MSHTSFQFGVAEVTGTSGPFVAVRCPHCHGIHRHDVRYAGSREVVAGCHRGHTACRSYSIPKAHNSPRAHR